MTPITPDRPAGRQRLSTSVAPETAQWLAGLAVTLGLPVGRVLDSLHRAANTIKAPPLSATQTEK